MSELYKQMAQDADDQFIRNLKLRLVHKPAGTTIEMLIEENLNWIRNRYMEALARVEPKPKGK